MMYFDLKEFRCKCCGQLPEDEQAFIEELVRNVLDPVRGKFGKPIKVNSGYRCEKHNAKVGGARHSQHMRGQAADICTGEKVANMTEFKAQNLEIARLIVKNGRFDQLILENVGENDLMPLWVHVSFNPQLNRGRVMKKVAGKEGYPLLTTEEICKLLGGNFRKA